MPSCNLHDEAFVQIYTPPYTRAYAGLYARRRREVNRGSAGVHTEEQVNLLLMHCPFVLPSQKFSYNLATSTSSPLHVSMFVTIGQKTSLAERSTSQ